MPPFEKDIEQLKNEIHEIQKWIRGNGKEGFATRLRTLEVVVERIDLALHDFIKETQEYRTAREKTELELAVLTKKQTSKEISVNSRDREYKSKSAWTWFIDKALPNVVSNLVMLILLALAITFLPAFDQMLARFLTK